MAEPALDLVTAGKRRVKAAYLVRLNQHGLAPCRLYSRKFNCVAQLGEARQQVSDVQPFPVIPDRSAMTSPRSQQFPHL